MAGRFAPRIQQANIASGAGATILSAAPMGIDRYRVRHSCRDYFFIAIFSVLGENCLAVFTGNISE